jgi:hypothetical protein
VRRLIKQSILPAIAMSCILMSERARAQEIPLESARPVVLCAVPEAGAGDVDPRTGVFKTKGWL